MSASERYEIDVAPPSRWMVPALALGAIVWSVLSQYEPLTYGRREALIRDRHSGELVGRFIEPPFVSRLGRFGLMLSEAATLPSEEFERKWIHSDDNVIDVMN